jgi:hypothetical protein
MLLAKVKTGECGEYGDIFIHVGTNDVRMKQSGHHAQHSFSM